MSSVDIFEVVFLVIVVGTGLGGFIWALVKEDED